MKTLLWIAAAVIIIGGGGYLLFTQQNAASVAINPLASTTNPFGMSNTSNTSTGSSTTTSASTQSPVSQAPVTQTPPTAPVSSGSGVSAFSSLSCSSLFPMDILQGAYPSVTFNPTAGMKEGQQNSIFFDCSYSAIGSGSNPSYTDAVAIYSTSVPYDSAVSSEKKNATCTASDIGSNSWECTSSGQDTVLFLTPNGWFVSVSSVAFGTSFKSGLALQMAEEVYSKLSA